MDRQGFINYNTSLSPENSRKASSYAQAIRILDEVLVYQNEIDLRGQSLYDIRDMAVLKKVWVLVKKEVKKMKQGLPNIFDHGQPNQKSYPLGGFCTAAVTSLMDYAQFEGAESIVREETNPHKISERLIQYFDLTREGVDTISESKRRKGQDYFRRLVLANYGGRCAMTGIDMPQLLLASHIIPWSDKDNKKERLNPCNGICLSALYDKAFDKGLISFSPDDYAVCLSSALRENETKEYFDRYFSCIIGHKLVLPEVFLPDRNFLAYHREKIFVGN